MDLRSPDELLETSKMTKIFVDVVISEFEFLADMGFALIESQPTLVRYQKKGIEADVYWGRKSNELGFEIAWNGMRFSISELMRATAPDEAERYLNPVATSQSALNDGLARLASLVKRYAVPALEGDQNFYERLKHGRTAWSQKFALDVLEAQIRPKANEAFHHGNYREAAALYEQIRSPPHRVRDAEVEDCERARLERRCPMQSHLPILPHLVTRLTKPTKPSLRRRASLTSDRAPSRHGSPRAPVAGSTERTTPSRRRWASRAAN